MVNAGEQWRTSLAQPALTRVGLDALGIRRRKAYAMKHTFLSIEVQHLGGRKLIELAAYCGTSVAVLEKHYVKRVDYVPTLGAASESPLPATEPERANLPGKVRTSRRKTQQNEAPRRDLNPRLRLNDRHHTTLETQVVHGLSALLASGRRVPEYPARGPSDPQNRQPLTVFGEAPCPAGYQYPSSTKLT